MTRSSALTWALSFVLDYVFNVAWALDVLANVATGGRRETISARLGRHKDKGGIVGAVCKVLDAMDPGHCDDARTWWDRARAKMFEPKNDGR